MPISLPSPLRPPLESDSHLSSTRPVESYLVGCPRTTGEQEEEMGLYERLLEEREKEERRGGRPLGASYGLDSPVLERRLGNPPKDRPPGYRRDLRQLHRYANEGCVLKAQPCASPTGRPGTARRTPS